MLIAAQYSGAQIKIADDFVFGETNKTEAFLKKFPLGKVRLLVISGIFIFYLCYVFLGKYQLVCFLPFFFLAWVFTDGMVL